MRKIMLSFGLIFCALFSLEASAIPSDTNVQLNYSLNHAQYAILTNGVVLKILLKKDGKHRYTPGTTHRPHTWGVNTPVRVAYVKNPPLDHRDYKIVYTNRLNNEWGYARAYSLSEFLSLVYSAGWEKSNGETKKVARKSAVPTIYSMRETQFDTVICLNDQRRYEVSFLDRDAVKQWQRGAPIKVIKITSWFRPYELVNLDTNEKVRAKLID